MSEAFEVRPEAETRTAKHRSSHTAAIEPSNGNAADPSGISPDVSSQVEGGEEEETEDEPRLKYKKLTSLLKNVYRNGDATSSVVVVGDKMIVGTHSGNVHALDVTTLLPIRYYHAHSASIACLSVSPVPSAPVIGRGSEIPSQFIRKSPSLISVKKAETGSPKTPTKQPPVLNNASNQIYIASASLDGHICVASLVDPADVTLRNFSRPIQAVALSPDYRDDRTYLSGGLAGQLVVTIDGKAGAKAQVNLSNAAATASGWLGAIGLGSNSGKDTLLHSGEGSISAIKFSRSTKYVAWINERGIKIMRSHLKLGNLDPDVAWRRFAHVDRPTHGAWEEMAGVWKGHLDWVRDSELEADQDTSIQAPSARGRRYEKLVVGWGDTAWIMHVSAGPTESSRPANDRILGKVDLVHKLTFDDCELSGLTLYTPSLLLVLAYRTRDDDDKPVVSRPAAGSRRQRHTGLQPELRIVNVANGEETDADTLPVDRFASLSAPDYHLSTLYIDTPVSITTRPQQKGALEALGAGLRDVSTNATRLFNSNASISSGTETADRRRSLLSAAHSAVHQSPSAKRDPGNQPALAPGLKIYLHSPYDLVLGMKRDLGDHLTWLLEHHRFGAAWELIDEHPTVVSIPGDTGSEPSKLSSSTAQAQGSIADFFDDQIASRSITSTDDVQGVAVSREKARIGEAWLEQLIKNDDWAVAGEVAGKVLVSPVRWEKWVQTFADAEHIPDIAEHIPGTHHRPQLPTQVYETTLRYFVNHDRQYLGELLDRFDPTMFDITTVVTAIEEQFSSQHVTEDSIEDGIAGRDWRILMNALAKFKLADGLPKEALRCYIRLKNSNEAMALIRDHQIIAAVADDIPGLLMLRTSDEQLKAGDVADLEEPSTEIVQLLVNEARERVIDPRAVVDQLNRQDGLFTPFLFLYFQSLWKGPLVDPEKILNSAERAHNSEQKLSGRRIVDDFADQAVGLFAKYDRDLLLDFLKQSNAYSLDRATEICEREHFIPEQVYLLSKTGQTKRALFLIIKELGDVSQAISFAKEHTDLWEDLLDYSMGKPPFILALLSEVGTSIDPVQFIRRIPDGLEIEGLKDGIQKMVREYDIQHSISQGAVRVFHSEVKSSIDVLRAGQKKAIKFEVRHEGRKEGTSVGDVEVKVDPIATTLDDETVRSAGMSKEEAGAEVGSSAPQAGQCAGCYAMFHVDESDFLVGNACGHVFHLQCLLDKLRVSDTERDLVKSLSSYAGDADEKDIASHDVSRERSGALIRTVNAKILDAQMIRSAVRDGCPTMLVEQFVASVGAGVTKSGSTAVKDVSILTLELQPTQARRSAELKKSTTAPNCLAISSSHIYAAQSDKAIVNVYNREKGSLEATVPFKEKITCLALACQGTLLVLGTEHGRLYLWETLSGRQLSTPQAHLQAITTVVVDPTSNFILSGSLDATIHVWSLPALVSFSSPPAGSEEHSRTAPIRTFSSHRNAITTITLGHSASFCNYAVSASKDGTVIVWDYHTETILRTVLLPDAVFCVTLDPADRAIYAGFEDGSIQSIDLLDNSHSVADTLSPNTASTVQPAPSTRWVPPSSDAVGAAHTLLVSYDGTRLITGHNAGKILVWDIPTGTYASNLTVPALSGPVTNLASIPITGYPATTSQPPFFKQSTVVKPRFGEYDLDAQGRVPESYTLSLQYTAPALDPDSDFYQALTHPSFPAEYLDECIHELAWSPSGAQTQASAPEELDTEAAKPSNSETEPRRTGNAGGGGAAEYEDDGFISLKEQKDLLHSKKNTATRQAAAAAAASSTQLASSSSEDSTTLLKAENARLKQQIAALKRVAKKSLEQVDALSRR